MFVVHLPTEPQLASSDLTSADPTAATDSPQLASVPTMVSLPTGTVTFLFTDIEGSTRLLQEVGD